MGNGGRAGNVADSAVEPVNKNGTDIDKRSMACNRLCTPKSPVAERSGGGKYNQFETVELERLGHRVTFS
jgi:hypothetical protein